jgi:hypothetical protein
VFDAQLRALAGANRRLTESNWSRVNLSEIVRLKAPEKIGAAAAAILARNHGHRYCGWSYEGKYIIQTEEPNLSALRAVALYKELSRKSSAPSAISKTYSTCGRSIIKLPIECRRTFLSQHWHLRSIAPLKKARSRRY